MAKSAVVSKTPDKKKKQKVDKKTPKSEKKSKITKEAAALVAEKIPSDDKENTKVVADEKENLVTVKREKVDGCIVAFKKLMENRKQSSDKQDLLDDEAKSMRLTVSGIKLPRQQDSHVMKIQLPHSYLLPDSDVLLIVKDLEKDRKADTEKTVLHYKQILEEKGVEGISEVMSLRELRSEHKQYEAKINLSNRIDKVLVDERVFNMVNKDLGKPFYKKKKLPMAVKLQADDLKAEVENKIKTSILPLNNFGSCSAVTIGHTEQSETDLGDNIEKALRIIEKRYPGGWKNVRSVHLNCENCSLPLYISLRSTKEVGFVKTINSGKQREPIEDELSTVPGAIVKVTPYGGVTVKRKPDPEWDSLNIEKKQKTANDDGDEDQEASEEKEDATESKAASKKDKKKENKKNAGKSKADSEESEDEMEDKELEYMRKIAEEEEELERREQMNQQNLDKNMHTGKKGKDDEDNEEEGDEDDDSDDEADDDDLEAENLLSDNDSGDDDINEAETLYMQKKVQQEPEADVEKSSKKKDKNKNKKDKSKNKKEKNKKVEKSAKSPAKSPKQGSKKVAMDKKQPKPGKVKKAGKK